MAEDSTTKRPHLVIRHWHGEAELWQAYWVIAIFGGWVFWTIVLNLVEFAILPDLAAVGILAGYSVYAAVGVWRCAFNAKWQGWAYVSRAIIMISAVTFAYELMQFS
jgi:hypothetical protein